LLQHSRRCFARSPKSLEDRPQRHHIGHAATPQICAALNHYPTLWFAGGILKVSDYGTARLGLNDATKPDFRHFEHSQYTQSRARFMPFLHDLEDKVIQTH
jgi:hypothetical protein